MQSGPGRSELVCALWDDPLELSGMMVMMRMVTCKVMIVRTVGRLRVRRVSRIYPSTVRKNMSKHAFRAKLAVAFGKVLAWGRISRRVEVVAERACSPGLATSLPIELAWDVR